MPANHTEIEKKLWSSADELRANSHLKSSEYSVPVLGLIFLHFADQYFAHVEQELTAIDNWQSPLLGSSRHVPATAGASMLMAHMYTSKANTTARCMTTSTIM